MFCYKNTSHIVNMKKQQLEIKLIKLGKKPGTRYCLGCKDFTNNFRPQKVTMTKKST